MFLVGDFYFGDSTFVETAEVKKSFMFGSSGNFAKGSAWVLKIMNYLSLLIHSQDDAIMGRLRLKFLWDAIDKAP